MKRIITFELDDKKNQQRFELMYTAIIIGVKPDAPRGGIEVFRREARILDALESVAPLDSMPGGKLLAGEPPRTVQAGTFELEQADFDYLLNKIKTADWFPSYARKVVDCVDWLSASEEG